MSSRYVAGYMSKIECIAKAERAGAYISGIQDFVGKGSTAIVGQLLVGGGKNHSIQLNSKIWFNSLSGLSLIEEVNPELAYRVSLEGIYF